MVRELTFTQFHTARSSAGSPRSASWEEWCSGWDVREVRESKDGPALVFGEIAAGKRRAGANVRAAHAIGVDVEKLSEDRIFKAFSALEPFEYFVWTTHSHTAESPRLRVVIPFAEPIEPSDYASTWRALDFLLGGANDPSTRDIGRLHYLPSCPPGMEEHASSWRHRGRWIAQSDLPDPSEHPSPLEQTKEAPLEVGAWVGKVIRSLQRVPKHEAHKEIARAVTEGKPFADPGNRHNAIRDLTWAIAYRFRALTTPVLSQVFGDSLRAMRELYPSDHPTLEEIESAYQSAVRKLTAVDSQEAEALRSQRLQEKRQRAMEGQLELANGARYTEEDFQRIAARNGWETEELSHRWILQHDGMFWLLGADGDYRGPYTEKDVGVASSQILARAPVRLTESTRDSFRYRAISDVSRERGTVVEKVISDLIAQRSWFDPITRTMHEAIRPLRPLDPVFDEEIDRWLRLLAGAHYPRLVDWLACVPDLGKLLCAVYFDGVPGSGKTLLATGLARLWTEGPPGDLEMVLGDFNDEIARCPLVLADEEIPRPYRTATVTTKLRSMLSTFNRTLKRKYKPPTELVGAVRLVLAANNEFLLDSKEVSSNQDLDAVAQRFLYIPVSQEATDFLNSLPRSTRERWAKDGIASHALHLHHTHEIGEPGKRFWVEGDISQMHRLLMTGSRWNSLVCEWLVRYCSNPKPYDTQASGLVRRGEGELLVNDQAVIDGWELYLSNTKSEPETAKVGAALRALSGPKRKQLKHAGKRIRYRIVDVDHLLAWSDRFNIGDRQTILEAVGNAPPREPGEDSEPVEDLATLPATNEGVPF